jgi:hypothetical protein
VPTVVCDDGDDAHEVGVDTNAAPVAEPAGDGTGDGDGSGDDDDDDDDDDAECVRK